jgi:hypothetical protein
VLLPVADESAVCDEIGDVFSIDADDVLSCPDARGPGRAASCHADYF